MYNPISFPWQYQTPRLFMECSGPRPLKDKANLFHGKTSEPHTEVGQTWLQCWWIVKKKRPVNNCAIKLHDFCGCLYPSWISTSTHKNNAIFHSPGWVTPSWIAFMRCDPSWAGQILTEYISYGRIWLQTWWPMVTLHTSPYVYLPHLATAWPLVE